jgi:hypothetical protein
MQAFPSISGQGVFENEHSINPTQRLPKLAEIRKPPGAYTPVLTGEA